jgi:SagB-type dehydrogenase family enzyme
MSPLFLNPNLVFYFQDSELVVNDLENNVEYTLERPYFECLWQVACGGEEIDAAIAGELEAGAILESEQRHAPAWGWDAVSRLFHVGTQYALPLVDRDERLQQLVDEHNQRARRPLVPVFTYREGTAVALPAPSREAMERSSLATVLDERKTCRDFLSQPIALQTLSNILFGTFGLLHGHGPAATGEPVTSVRRAYPSGGNVHAEEVYVVVYRVEDLAAGLYHYQPREHVLTALSQGDHEERVVELNNCQYFSEGLAFGIYIVLRLSRSWWKYPISRAYRVLMMDVGHAAQTFHLAVTAHGLQTWQTAAFDEVAVNRFLQLENDDESAFLYLGCGHGTRQAYPDDYRAAFATTPS